MGDTTDQRVPDMREQLARFNLEREALLGGMPINPTEDRMPIARTGVGGDLGDPYA